MQIRPGQFDHIALLRCAEDADFHAANSAYLAKLPTGSVEHAEDAVTQVPMIGRIRSLLMIDILAVGVAMRRGVNALLRAGDGAPSNSAPAVRRNGPMLKANESFTHLTPSSRSGSG